jgi:hypothetical protein
MAKSAKKPTAKRRQNNAEERDIRIDDILARAKRLAARAKGLKKQVAKLRRDVHGKKAR